MDNSAARSSAISAMMAPSGNNEDKSGAIGKIEHNHSYYFCLVNVRILFDLCFIGEQFSFHQHVNVV